MINQAELFSIDLKRLRQHYELTWPTSSKRNQRCRQRGNIAMSIRKRENSMGIKKEAWVVNYRDKSKGGARVQRAFRLKKDADAFLVDARVEVRDGVHIARSKPSPWPKPAGNGSRWRQQMTWSAPPSWTTAAFCACISTRSPLKTVQKRLGHANITTTADVYGQPFSARRRSCRDGRSRARFSWWVCFGNAEENSIEKSMLRVKGLV
jgi:hypothetical protein